MKATRDSTAGPETKPKAVRRRVPASRPRRASQRTVIDINLAKGSLRELMIEQCRSKGAYITVYRGSRDQLLSAGVPENAFPAGVAMTAFQVQTLNVCCTGSRELFTGSMRACPLFFELEIDWGHVRPYMQGAHPAVMELARMLLKDILAWTDKETLEGPIDRLAADPRAEDYKPGPAAPRLRVTPEFRTLLKEQASAIFSMVHSCCEVCPSEATQQRPSLRVVTEAPHG